MKKNVLLLGQGYIGTYLFNFLKNYDNELNVYSLSKKHIDYTNPKVFDEWLNKNRMDWVVNCSGFTGTPNVDGCEDHKEECYHYNVSVPLYITKVCNRYNAKIIHIGSGCVYSGYDKIYSEEDVSDFGTDCFESSFYSKTKDAFEKLSVNMQRYIFRIRIPFSNLVEQKNYLYKIVNYDKLISKQNSITCVDDLLVFIKQFISLSSPSPSGVYNVVNRGSVDASDVVQMLKDNGVSNPKWEFVSIKEANFRVNRSNCILSTKKIENLGLGLPDVKHSLEKCVRTFSDVYKLTK